MIPKEFNPETGETTVAFEGFTDLTTALVLLEMWGPIAGLDVEERANAADLLTHAIFDKILLCLVPVPQPEKMLDALLSASFDATVPHARKMVECYEEHLVLDDGPTIAFK